MRSPILSPSLPPRFCSAINRAVGAAVTLKHRLIYRRKPQNVGAALADLTSRAAERRPLVGDLSPYIYDSLPSLGVDELSLGDLLDEIDGLLLHVIAIPPEPLTLKLAGLRQTIVRETDRKGSTSWKSCPLLSFMPQVQTFREPVLTRLWRVHGIPQARNQLDRLHRLTAALADCPENRLKFRKYLARLRENAALAVLESPDLVAAVPPDQLPEIQSLAARA